MRGARAGWRAARRAAWAVLTLAPGAAAAACGSETRAGDVAVPWSRAPVAEVAASIGVVDGPPEYTFGDITSVALDRAGRIYVADRIGSTVRVYGRDGAFLEQVGREGKGPGEVERPSDLTFGPDGRLYVEDGRGITLLAPREPGGIPDSVSEVWSARGGGSLGLRRAHVDASGTYFDPVLAYRLRPRGRVEAYYVAIRSGRPTGDTVRLPPYANSVALLPAYYMVSGRGGRVVPTLAHAPFEAVPGWDLTPRGTVVGGGGASQRLVESDAAGEALDSLPAVRRGRRPVPPAERSDSLAAFRARVDSLPVPPGKLRAATEAVRDGRLPDSLPAFRSVRVGEGGAIWIERWPPSGGGGRTYFDVLSPDGTYRGSIVFPVRLTERPVPFLGDAAACGVVRDPGTGVERVVELAYRFGR